MYQCATVCESIRIKSAKNAFFSKNKHDTRFDDCTNTPGVPHKTPPIITRLFLQEEKKESTFCGPREASWRWQMANKR